MGARQLRNTDVLQFIIVRRARIRHALHRKGDTASGSGPLMHFSKGVTSQSIHRARVGLRLVCIGVVTGGQVRCALG